LESRITAGERAEATRILLVMTDQASNMRVARSHKLRLLLIRTTLYSNGDYQKDIAILSCYLEEIDPVFAGPLGNVENNRYLKERVTWGRKGVEGMGGGAFYLPSSLGCVGCLGWSIDGGGRGPFVVAVRNENTRKSRQHPTRVT
jgi:hypothetical protein